VVQLLCLIKQGYLPITRHESDLSDNSVIKRINECLETLSHNVVSSTLRYEQGSNSQR
jgi:hypothetical protein